MESPLDNTLATDGLRTTIKEIEDYLGPQLQLTVWERVVYYHLLRHTRLEDRTNNLFAIGSVARTLALSDSTIRDVLRSLERKGCTSNEVTRRGYQVTVFLPNEIAAIERSSPNVETLLDIEDIDFFNNRTYVSALLERESNQCFYCLSKVSEENCELDHVIPEANGRNHGYRNIVVTCHRCNRKKGSSEAANFLRLLFRDGFLSEDDFTNRLMALNELASGDLKPSI